MFVYLTSVLFTCIFIFCHIFFIQGLKSEFLYRIYPLVSSTYFVCAKFESAGSHVMFGDIQIIKTQKAAKM